MKHLDSIFKCKHTSEAVLENLCRLYNPETKVLVYPFISSGYVLNNLLKNYHTGIERVIIADDNIGIIQVYSSVILFADELIEALKYLEEVYNLSTDKKYMYDLCLCYWNACVKYRDIFIGSQIIENLNIEDFIEKDSLKFNKQKILDYSTNTHKRFCLEDAYCNTSYYLSKRLDEDTTRKPYRQYLKSIGGYIVRKSKEEFDTSFIDSISQIGCVTEAALFIFLNHLSKENTFYRKKTLKENKTTFYVGAYDKDANLFFGNVYETIKEVYDSLVNIDTHTICLDFRNIYTKLILKNYRTKNISFYINLYDIDYNYDMYSMNKFANIINSKYQNTFTF